MISLIDISSSGGGGSCFPAIATVKLENGNSVTMSDLQIGDQVKTGKPSFLFRTKPHR